MSATSSLDNVMEAAEIGARERFEAVAHSVRDVLSQRWIRTEKTYERKDPKRVYYLSMEFLIGRSLVNNVTNLLLDDVTKKAVQEKKLNCTSYWNRSPTLDWVMEGVGRGGHVSSIGWLRWKFLPWVIGLRYQYGMFKQTIQDGWQHEVPDNWLHRPDPWQVLLVQNGAVQRSTQLLVQALPVAKISTLSSASHPV